MSNMQHHTFTITVSGCTAEEAEQVMAERTAYDEDYGFYYLLGAAKLTATADN